MIERDLVKFNELPQLLGDMIAIEYDKGNIIPEKDRECLAADSAAFIGNAQALMKIYEERHNRIKGENEREESGIMPAIFSKISEISEQKKEQELHDAARKMIGYLQNDPANPVAFSYRKRLAELLLVIGNIMSESQILLPTEFFTAVKSAAGPSSDRSL